jgi:ubiquinol-cytochrome c reductase cytochrome c subunit
MTRLPITIATLALLAAPAFAEPTPTGDATRGKVIYMRDACYTCHGTTGASTSFVGPKLAHAGLTAGQILRQLRHPQAQMPAYTETVLPDSEAADLIAYVLSLSQGPKPTGKDIPLLNR